MAYSECTHEWLDWASGEDQGVCSQEGESDEWLGGFEDVVEEAGSVRRGLGSLSAGIYETAHPKGIY